jgi:gamma-glutamylcyclotransferase (GGCT)/AIG2-like uncharacterized protein YtfP
VFEVQARGWAALDAKEGAPNCYQRRSLTALTPDGQSIPVTTYVVRPERCCGYVAPAPEYLSVVREGMLARDLPDTALAAAAAGESVPWALDALFAYGTLMRGESRFSLLRAAGLECTLLATARGRLLDLGAYPAMLPPDTDGQYVQGEFVRLHHIGRALREFDRVEGFLGFDRPGSLFRRSLMDVDAGDGRIRRAWCYQLENQSWGGQPIPSGDWREYRGRRAAFLAGLAAAHSGGDEARLARALAGRIPFAFNADTDAVARNLQPLANSLASGQVSERRMAQVSGRWATVPRL